MRGNSALLMSRLHPFCSFRRMLLLRYSELEAGCDFLLPPSIRLIDVVIRVTLRYWDRSIQPIINTTDSINLVLFNNPYG